MNCSTSNAPSLRPRAAASKRPSAAIAEALRWYGEGALNPRPSHEFPLEEAADILEAQATREIVGKAVLTIGAT